MEKQAGSGKPSRPQGPGLFSFQSGCQDSRPLSSYRPAAECLGRAWHGQVALRETGPPSPSPSRPERPREDTGSSSLPPGGWPPCTGGEILPSLGGASVPGIRGPSSPVTERKALSGDKDPEETWLPGPSRAECPRARGNEDREGGRPPAATASSQGPVSPGPGLVAGPGARVHRCQRGGRSWHKWSWRQGRPE